MKKLYILIASLVILSLPKAEAQTQLTQAVDFTVTDIHGVQHNLFNILAGGQYVCIDFFFTTCPPCIATSPMYKQTFQNFGCNQEDIFFIAVDYNDTDQEVIAYENSVLGGSPGYPAVSGTNGGGNAVVSTYQIGAFPTYILIAPNQQIVEQDMWPISNAGTFTTYFASHNLLPIACSTTSINDLDGNSGLGIYPNPASDQIYIHSPVENADFKIYNVIGENVFSGRTATSKESLDISSLKNGLYFVEIISNTKRYSAKFVKQ